MIQELGGDLIPVLAISLTFLFLAIWVVAATIDSIYKTRCDFRLKERLIQRGASPTEIQQILLASSDPDEMENVPVPPVKTGQAMSMSR